MRKGDNKSKNIKIGVTSCEHRVIIPLYVPVEEGYYKQSFDIFKMCLSSVRKTSVSKIKVSVVSNGSSANINSKLLDFQNDGLIDELIIERENIGKINSVLKVLRSTEERFITITDADVLFLNNWEKEVMSIFKEFPDAAAVSPLPVFRTQNHYTSSILFDYFFSNKLKFSKVKNPDALTLFAKSIGWSYLDDKWKDCIMTIESKNGTKAVVGCNHCVVTYKREIFNGIPSNNSKYKLGGDSEGLYLDIPAQYFGGYRLATYDNFAYHLGNTIETWMLKDFNNLINEEKKDHFTQSLFLKKSIVRHFFKNIIFKKIISRKAIRKIYYRKKGLKQSKLIDFF
ncbi:glycosyltransferase family 2 protein [Bizionia saleffrena]|uniref:Glycosyltransferase family 2 protein n=1 Tax=Bizionia saleffrena TaxID=291189 RepID=A0A8H2LGP2_9FLAO|nr:glycosyltransferase family A protein [Bizionia saleffrena]TYB80167.1 glycosyltransferase family 2 protein [Bizionia saleffrena]